MHGIIFSELRKYVEGLWDDVLRAFGEEAERMVAHAAKEAEAET